MAKRIKEKAAARREAKDTRPSAVARYIRIAPSKVRVVMKELRGKPVNEALALLQSVSKSASDPLYKVISSAAANAENNNGMLRDELYIAELRADAGPTYKRFQPVSKGRGHSIMKRTSHLTVILDTKGGK